MQVHEAREANKLHDAAARGNAAQREADAAQAVAAAHAERDAATQRLASALQVSASASECCMHHAALCASSKGGLLLRALPDDLPLHPLWYDMLQDLQQAQAGRAADLAHLEARVRATLVRKDDTIATLRMQLDAVRAQQAATDAVLAHQRAELGC